MTELFEPTLDDLIAAADREVRMRENAYPRFVANGKMKQATADRELELMRAIAHRLRQDKAAGSDSTDARP